MQNDLVSKKSLLSDAIKSCSAYCLNFELNSTHCYGITIAFVFHALYVSFLGITSMILLKSASLQVLYIFNNDK